MRAYADYGDAVKKVTHIASRIWVGLLALFNGINQIVLAFELKSAQHR